MGKKMFSLACARLILVAREEDVVLMREGARGKLVAEIRGIRVAMHANSAEIGAEARLHEFAHVGSERLAARRVGLDGGLNRARDILYAAASRAHDLFL